MAADATQTQLSGCWPLTAVHRRRAAPPLALLARPSSRSFQSLRPRGGRSRAGLHAGGLGQLGEEAGIAVAGEVGVGGGDQAGIRVGRRARRSSASSACDRGRPHAAGGGKIERVGPRPLEGGQAQGVDRCFDHHQPGRARRPARQPEQRLLAVGGETAPLRSAHLDAGELAIMAAMGKPGAAIRALPQHLMCHGARQHPPRQPARAREVAPGGAALRQRRPAPPSARRPVAVVARRTSWRRARNSAGRCQPAGAAGRAPGRSRGRDRAAAPG